MSNNDGESNCDIENAVHKKNLSRSYSLFFFQWPNIGGTTGLRRSFAGISSKSDTAQRDAAKLLGSFRGSEALSLAEYVLVGRSEVPGMNIPFNAERPEDHFIHQQAREDVADIFGNFVSDSPEFFASFKRVYKHNKKDSYIVRKLFKGIRDCGFERCLELLKLGLTSSDSIVRGLAYQMLYSFEMDDRIYSLLQKGLKSFHHFEKAGAAYALFGRQSPQILPLIDLALRSMYDLTRIYAIAALIDIKSPEVFDLYLQGVKDSDAKVRLFTLHELSRRLSEPQARRLLMRVAENSAETEPRNDADQIRRVPKLERLIERARSMGLRIKGSPGLVYLAWTTTAYRPIDRFISTLSENGQSEQDLAKFLLEEFDRTSSTSKKSESSECGQFFLQ